MADLNRVRVWAQALIDMHRREDAMAATHAAFDLTTTVVRPRGAA